MALLAPFNDLDGAGHAFARVSGEIDAIPADQISAMNLDLVSATSVVLGVVDRILPFRDRMVQLPEFDSRNVDSLVDYALAAWYVYVTNLPAAEPGDAEKVMTELLALRSKLLMWADPLANSGKFDSEALGKIKEGAGHKDAASDVLSLVGLYRARWDEVKSICAVTEEDLGRGVQIAPLAFGLVSRRENRAASSASEASLRVRRAWTLLERAYGQCRRALYFLRFAEEDTDRIAPNLRRNSGPPKIASSSAQEANIPADASAGVTEATPALPEVSTMSPGLGGNGSPFAAVTAQTARQ